MRLGLNVAALLALVALIGCEPRPPKPKTADAFSLAEQFDAEILNAGRGPGAFIASG